VNPLSPADPTAGDNPTERRFRLRVSHCGVWSWHAGRLIWDDYLDHRQFELPHGAERVLAWFAHWREAESVRGLDATPGDTDRYVSLSEALLAANLLVREGSPRQAREDAVLRSWSAWGPLARAFHYGTRTRMSDRFLDPDQQSAAFDAKHAVTPPPPAVSGAPEAALIALPAATDGIFRHRDLLDVLRRRRSRRTFGTDPLPLAVLGALLQVGAGVVRIDERTATVFKASPSGGGRHPTELYVHVRQVSGLRPGVYRYDALRHALERIGEPPPTAELVAATGDQQWVADASVVLCYTCAFARNAWKYESPRSYRVLLLDVGHLSQTLWLTATALGLHSTFTAALRDELVERHLHIDPATELVIGCTAIGTPS
jgi:SagB-type dehydrogenase family enzyme